jgi:hypothetical protein
VSGEAPSSCVAVPRFALYVGLMLEVTVDPLYQMIFWQPSPLRSFAQPHRLALRPVGDIISDMRSRVVEGSRTYDKSCEQAADLISVKVKIGLLISKTNQVESSALLCE